MKALLPYLTFQAPHKSQVRFLMIVISIAYLFNFHVNDIWTPNESFYAEAVREMFESGNFLDISYNYEPRYNKPPLTYWLMAGSSAIFGFNEFSLRLPIVLLALGSIWVSYLLGRLLYGDKGGLYTMAMMAVSVQLLAVKQYASPEIPLTFFFTWSLYLFIKGYKERNVRLIYLFYLALGLAALTKGYPYYVVIGGIVGLYVLWENKLNWPRIWKDVKFLRLHLGIPIALAIGMSWIIFMYLKDGDAFWTVYKRETFERAFTRESKGLRPFFYIEVTAWSIIPYSLAFFYAIIYWIKNWKNIARIAFPLSWFLVMLVIFTAAKGKIPTYFIQAHPALLLMIVPLLLEYKPTKTWKWPWNLSFMIFALAALLGTVYMTYVLSLPFWIYLLSACGLFGFIYWLLNSEANQQLNVAIPFWSVIIFMLAFATYLPRMEQFRPYDDLGSVINDEENIDKGIPIYIQNTLIHNIPIYAERKAIRDQTMDQINTTRASSVLALVKEESLDSLNDFKSLWNGYIYDSSSESQFLKFALACKDAEQGDFSKFARYSLVLRAED